ncbi:MAG: hypothetical protein GY932_02535 [Arcobacter sp.]|nr:hypothetical protein [Arcobacter sp.]
MKQLSITIAIIFIFNACSTKYENINLKQEQKNIIKLTNKILRLSNHIDKEEAKRFSYETINYSKTLAKNYKVTTPALIHNTLINLNIKQKGYCYHYANDLINYLKDKKFKSFYFKKVVSKRGEYFEHTALILTRDDISFHNSLVFDAWRNTGDLFWSKIKDDKKYKWEIR